MRNALNSINGIKSVREQREELLKLNNDIIYGVYYLKDSFNGLKFSMREDILTCYPNQLDNLKGLEENKDITILDINSLRKGEVKTIFGKDMSNFSVIDIKGEGFLKSLFSSDKKGNSEILSIDDKKEIIDFFKKNNTFKTYAPKKNENITFMEGEISPYKLLNGELVENENGYNLLDYFEVISKEKGEIKLKLRFYLNTYDGMNPQTLTETKIYTIKTKEKGEKINKPTLLSSGVIELVRMPNPKGGERIHTFTSLRDGGAADKLQRTGVAGRNSFDNLNEELEREYSEESPFLLQVDGVWTLATPDRKNKTDAISDLKTSVEYFLKNKYNLDRNNPEQAEFVKMFERSFRGKIKYEELGDILKEAISNNRIEFFENKELDSFPGLEKDMKKIEIVDDNGKIISSGNYFIYHDESNNTVEYRSLREIKAPEWFDAKKQGFNPSQRLFLESQNQSSKTRRIEDLGKDSLVPTAKYFAEKIRDIL